MVIRPPKLLLVEGRDDEEVVRRIRDGYPDVPAFEVEKREGWPEIVKELGPDLNAPGRIALGIMVDANLSPEDRWQAISDRLIRHNVQTPSRIGPTGIIINHDPRVGIWLMPDNNSEGELEDFVRRLIPSSDPIWPRAQGYIDSIPEVERKFTSKKALRAQVHAWLATRSRPRLMGTAIAAGDLDTTVPIAQCFVAWLCRLFG